MFVIPRGILEARKIASEDKNRFAMDGLRLERGPDGRARAVATDGKRFVLISWDDSTERAEFPEIGFKTEAGKPGTAVMIPNDSIDNAVKIMPKKCPKPIFGYLAVEEEETNGKIRLGSTNLESDSVISTRQLEGHFPPYDEVVASSMSKPATFRVCLNADFLLELTRTLHRASGSDRRDDSVRLEFSSPDEPVRCSIGTPNGIEAVAILMPINADGWTNVTDGSAENLQKAQTRITSLEEKLDKAKNSGLNAQAERNALETKLRELETQLRDARVERDTFEKVAQETVDEVAVALMKIDEAAAETTAAKSSPADPNGLLLATKNLELVVEIEKAGKAFSEIEAKLVEVETRAHRAEDRAQKAEAGLALIESVLGGKKLAA